MYIEFIPYFRLFVIRIASLSFLQDLTGAERSSRTAFFVCQVLSDVKPCLYLSCLSRFAREASLSSRSLLHTTYPADTT